MTRKSHRTVVLCATTIALCSSALAHAAPPARTVELPPVKVSFSDLNLDTPAGAKVLYGRINAAAAQACGPNLAMWYPGKARAAKQCFDATVDQAVKQLNRPALSALHEQGHSLSSSVTARAQAGDPKAEPLTRAVSYAGLKLTRQADVALLYGRIAAAAAMVCDPVAVGSDTAAKLRVKRCVAESIERAVADVNSPALSRYYAAKTRQMEASVALSEAH